MKKSIIITVCIAIAAAVALMWYSGLFLPAYVTWENKQLCNGNLELKNKKVSFDLGSYYEYLISEGKDICLPENMLSDELLWKGPKNCLVSDVLLADVDKDSDDELIVLCWRIGRYGNTRPFFIKLDPPVWSQHIYVYEISVSKNSKDIQDAGRIVGNVRAKWMASDIGLDVKSIRYEGDTLILVSKEDEESHWKYDYFGFTRMD